MNVFAVYLDGNNRTLPNRAIEWILGECDWFRLMNGRMYFVATVEASEPLYEKFKNVLHEGDQIFMVPILKGDSSIGFLPNEAWTWLKKYFPDFLIGSEIPQYKLVAPE